jgi:hypothetical protein
MGGCEKTNTPTRYLRRAPKCFSLQLAWDISISGETIATTLAAVDEEVHLSEVGARRGGGRGGARGGRGRRGLMCCHLLPRPRVSGAGWGGSGCWPVAEQAP